MERKACLAAIQPPHPYAELSNTAMLKRALELLDEAGKAGADIALLPELINIFMVPRAEFPQKIGPELDELKSRTATIATHHQM